MSADLTIGPKLKKAWQIGVKQEPLRCTCGVECSGPIPMDEHQRAREHGSYDRSKRRTAPTED